MSKTKIACVYSMEDNTYCVSAFEVCYFLISLCFKMRKRNPNMRKNWCHYRATNASCFDISFLEWTVLTTCSRFFFFFFEPMTVCVNLCENLQFNDNNRRWYLKLHQNVFVKWNFFFLSLQRQNERMNFLFLKTNQFRL